MSQIFELTAPASAQALQVLRAVVAAGSTRTELDIDSVEDLRMAVDEAGVRLLRHASPEALLHLRVHIDADQVEIKLFVEAEVEVWPPSRRGEGMGWQIIRRLTDDASYYREGDFPGIQLSKRAS